MKKFFKQQSELLISYCTTKINQALIELADPLFNPNTDTIRVIDQTLNTDDPGNTQLIIAFIPFNSETYEANDYQQPTDKQLSNLSEMLSKQFTSDGDHHEEITVLTQNSEILLILNFNK